MRLIILIPLILLLTTCIQPPEPRIGVGGRFLFAGEPPPPDMMNVTLAACNMDVPAPYCSIDSDNVWQFAVDGYFEFDTEPGDYGIAAYVSWMPQVILLHDPETGAPLIFEIGDAWLELGAIEYSDPWPSEERE